MFHSAVRKYNIVDATPFERDPMKELAAACAKRGIKLCFYYSQAQDWHEPGGAQHAGTSDPTRRKRLRHNTSRQSRMPQVREMLTHYGPIGLIWFDTPGADDARTRRAVRRPGPLNSSPTCLINGRLGPAAGNDYQSRGDNEFPHTVMPGALGNARHDQRHVGLQEGRPPTGRPPDDHLLQAGGHRQQRRQLPAQRRPDGRGRDSAAQPGHPRAKSARG